MSALTDRFMAVQERLEKAQKKAGREAETIRLVAVSKWHAPPAIVELAAFWASLNGGGVAGLSAALPAFGESYAQEAAEKIPLVTDALKKNNTLPPQWHFIGHLQSRKAKTVAGRFALVHSLESESLAAALEKHTPAGQVQPVLVQVNIGREPQKSGVMPENLEPFLITLGQYPRVAVQGLMAMPPYNPDGEFSRPFFTALRALRDKAEDHLGLPLPLLSMGMSHDMEVAIEEGATIVRVGTDIFGPREY